MWENIEKFIKAAKAKDNKLIPNFVENFTEDIFEKVFVEIKGMLDLNELLESILREEKKAIKIRRSKWTFLQ